MSRSAAAPLARAPAAVASTFAKSGSTLVFTAAPGETNDVQISHAQDGTYALSDADRATFDPSTGCDLGDGDDTYIASGPVSQTVHGGDGNDKVTTRVGRRGSRAALVTTYSTAAALC